MPGHTKFQLSEIIRIEKYFHEEINQRKSCSKNISKYVTTFDYIDKTLIVLSAASSGVCIISIASIVEAQAAIAKASLTFFFSNYSNNLKIVKHNKKQKENARYDSYIGWK